MYGAILTLMRSVRRHSRKERPLRRLKHFLIPHKGNKYKPGLFARESIATVALVLLLIEAAYLVQVHVVLKNAGLASVLPAALTTLTNADRAAEGISPVREDADLDKVAAAKAADMAAKGYFAHVSPSGKTPWDWLDEGGYQYTYAGENLAVDFTESKDVEEAWMNSPLHRANILKQQYTRVGIGVAEGIYQGKQVTFVAQFFATKAADGAAAQKPVVTASAAKTPASEPAETHAEAQVLGAAVQPAPAAETPTGSQIAVEASSPSRFMWYILTGFTGAIAFFFVLTLFVHQRRRMIEVEVIGSGLALLAVAALMYIYNGNSVSYVQTPEANQAASVAISLE